MSILELYLLNVMFSLKSALYILMSVGVLMIALIPLFIAVNMPDSWDDERGKEAKKSNRVAAVKAFKVTIKLMLICLLSYTFIPTKEEAVWIAGGYIATNIEGIEDMPANAVKAVNAFLESVADGENSDK